MNNKSRSETLADRLAGVLSAAPTTIDPEDNHDETIATLTDKPVEDDSQDEILLSKFRKQNIDLLEDVDHRYVGKTGSRRVFGAWEDGKSEEESDDNSEFNDFQMGREEDEESDDSEKGKIEEDNDTSDNSNESDEFESGDDVEQSEESEVEDTDFKHMRNSDSSGQLQKGVCIKNQLNLWETFLEMRIQMQKCLITSNKMPQYDKFNEFIENPEFKKKTNETKKAVCGVLDKLLELQNLLVRKNPETKNILKEGANIKNKEVDDDEIPSDTEEELSESENEEEIVSPKKKLKISEYESYISNMHNKYTPFRNSVIQKWNDKTRIATGKNISGHSVINQIEHNLSDREKLIKRTQIKRSEYQIVGVKIDPVDPENAPRFIEEHNSEIFDDDDFYHQLLRELIEVKSADLTDPVQLGRQWIQLQNLRSKMKRKIDTKATKGRKIRYAIHTKLVNFMAPIDENNYTDDAKTELFNSLFGKTQHTVTV